MIEDNKGNLWIIAENALACFHPDKETFEHYDKKYLQQDLYFTEAAPVQDQHHQLLLGTDIGILRIFPEQLQKSSYVPPIVFTGLKIQGASQDLDIDDLKELKLKPVLIIFCSHLSFYVKGERFTTTCIHPALWLVNVPSVQRLLLNYY